EVRDFVIFAVVNADRVIAADPLTPAMQPQPAVERALVGGKLRVADEEEARLEASLGQRPRQFFYANAQPARLRVLVGALEGKQAEGRLIRPEHQETLHCKH